MCNDCGCREFPLIGRLSQEHWDIKECAGALRRAIQEGRHAEATALLDELLAPEWPAVLEALDRLHQHIDHEEHGLFPAAVIVLPFAAWDHITPEQSSAGVP